jgi:hypothetical protein
VKKRFTHIFDSRKHHDEDDNSLSDAKIKAQIDNALNDCISEKKQEQKKLDDLKTHAKDLIFEIFQVPEVFWYEELDQYEKIKTHEANRSLAEEIIKKTDELIEIYRTKIKRCVAKIELCANLTGEFESLIQKFEETKLEIQKAELEEKQKTIINKHLEYIKKEDEPNDSSIEIMKKGDKLEQLKEEIREIDQNFRLRLKVKAYMKKIDEDSNLFEIKTDINSLRDIIEKFKKD